ncbi:MAG: hypothetical protein V3T72_10865 [Thermoanaerobaculia bacterium]
MPVLGSVGELFGLDQGRQIDGTHPKVRNLVLDAALQEASIIEIATDGRKNVEITEIRDEKIQAKALELAHIRTDLPADRIAVVSIDFLEALLALDAAIA